MHEFSDNTEIMPFNVIGSVPALTYTSIQPLPRTESGLLLASIQRRLALHASVPEPEVVSTTLLGYVDHAGPTLITGWAQKPRHPESPVCLDIRLGGRRIGRVLANQYRADLRQAGIGSGCHGFTFRRPPDFTGEVGVSSAIGNVMLPFTEAAKSRAA